MSMKSKKPNDNNSDTSKKSKPKNNKIHYKPRSKPRNKTKNLRKRTHSSLTSTHSKHSNKDKDKDNNHHTNNNNHHHSSSQQSNISSSYTTTTHSPSYPHSHSHSHSPSKSPYGSSPSSYSNLPRNRISKHNKKKRINKNDPSSTSHHHGSNYKKSSSRSNRYKQLKSKQASNYASSHHGHHHSHYHHSSNILSSGPSKDKIIQYKKNLYSDDIAKQLHAVSQLRILLSDEQQPPIDLVIRSNCVPRLIDILHSRESINLLFETAWVLTNICSGSHDHTMAVVEANGIECILSLLDLKDIAVLEQSIWVLGNIAGDGTNARDICLDKGVLTRLIQLAQEQNQLKSFTTKVPAERRQIVAPAPNHSTHNNLDLMLAVTEQEEKADMISSVPEMPLSFQRNFVWTISNLVRGKPQPSWDKVSCVIPIILLYLNSPDLEVLTDTCWALSYLSDGCNEHIQSILDLSMLSEIDISQYLVKFLDKKSMNVLVPALRTCGNIVSGSDHQTQQIIDRGLLTKLKRLLRHPNHSVKKEAIWTVSNITAGNPTQIQSVIDHGLIEPLVDILTDYHADHDLVKECIWAISNATTGGTTNQLRYLSQYASIGLSRVMSHFPCDKKLQLVLLEGLDNLLSFTTENPIPLSQSPLANMLLLTDTNNSDHKSSEEKKASDASSAIATTVTDTITNSKKKMEGKDNKDNSSEIDQIQSGLTSINEETEQYIKIQANTIGSDNNEEYKNIELSVDKTDADYNDIYDISSEESEAYIISDEYDIDKIHGNQNYVAYIMEQTEAHRILEDWYYDTNQDPDVAQLARQISSKYFNEPYQF